MLMDESQTNSLLLIYFLTILSSLGKQASPKPPRTFAFWLILWSLRNTLAYFTNITLTQRTRVSRERPPSSEYLLSVLPRTL